MSIYVCIDDHWFDLSFFKDHPGGTSILRRYHLKDASDIFNDINGHHDAYCYSLMKKYEIKDKDILDKITLSILLQFLKYICHKFSMFLIDVIFYIIIYFSIIF